MAYSLQREVSDGSLQYVNITIQYFDKKDLFVYKDGLVVPKTSDEPSAEWSYVWDGDRIKINKVVPIGAEILVRRKTPYAEPMHVYRQGAVFKDSTMDDNFLQMLFINQENVEGLTATDFYNDLDFHGYRLKNVGAAKVGTDAVPYSQYVADASGAYQNRIAAEQARDTTEGFKAEAQTAMATAKEWANKLGATVDATEYSAKYYSIKANEYSVSAKNSKDAAAVSETNALQSKNDTVLLKTQTQQIVDQAQGSLDQIAEINSLVNDVKGARLPVGVLVPFPVEGNYPGYIKTGSSFDKVAYPQLAALFPSGQIPARNENGVLAGSIIHWYSEAVPTGYLEFNGQAFDKALCPDLARIFPSGKLPDLRGEFLRGVDGGRGVDAGRVLGSFQGQAIQSHSHTSGVLVGNGWNYPELGSATGGTGGAVPQTGATGGAETRPRNVAVKFITPVRDTVGVVWYIKAADTVGQPEVIQAQDLVNRTSALEGKVTTVEGKVAAIENNNLNKITELDGTTNLNGVIVAGFYSKSYDGEATAALNYPALEAGTLLVQATPHTLVQSQIYITWNTNTMYTRTRYRDRPGEWSAWAKCYTSANMRFEF